MQPVAPELRALPVRPVDLGPLVQPVFKARPVQLVLPVLQALLGLLVLLVFLVRKA